MSSVTEPPAVLVEHLGRYMAAPPEDDLSAWLRRQRESALLAGPANELPVRPPRGQGGYTAQAIFNAPSDNAYDIVQAVKLSLSREVSVDAYRDMTPTARQEYHLNMAAHFRNRAVYEPRLAAYFIARAVLHDESARRALARTDDRGEQSAESLNRAGFLEVLGLISPPP